MCAIALKHGTSAHYTIKHQQNLFTYVTRPGFEPRQAESESAVLPLYYRAIKFECKLKEKIKQSF